MNQKKKEEKIYLKEPPRTSKVINITFFIYFCGKLRGRKLIFQKFFGKNNSKNEQEMKISSLIKREEIRGDGTTGCLFKFFN